MQSDSLNSFPPFFKRLVPFKDTSLVSLDSVIIRNTQSPSKEKVDSSVRYSQSIFDAHELKVTNRNGIIRDTNREDWLIGVLVLIVMVIAYLRVSYYRRFNQLVSAAFDFQISNQLIREESILTQRVSLFLTTVFGISLSMFISQFLKYNQISIFGLSSIKTFVSIMGLVVAVYFVKIVSIRLVGNVFQIQKETDAYVFNIFLYNKLSGLLLLPIVVFVRFMPAYFYWYLFFIGVGLFTASFIARIIRGISIGVSKKGVLGTHIVLYFCTLEILPILLSIKFLSNLFA